MKSVDFPLPSGAKYMHLQFCFVNCVYSMIASQHCVDNVQLEREKKL